MLPGECIQGGLGLRTSSGVGMPLPKSLPQEGGTLRNYTKNGISGKTMILIQIKNLMKELSSPALLGAGVPIAIGKRG